MENIGLEKLVTGKKCQIRSEYCKVGSIQSSRDSVRHIRTANQRTAGRTSETCSTLIGCA
jgi:hypothetical protein